MNKDDKELNKRYQLIQEAFEPVDYDSVNDNVRKLLYHIMKQIDDAFTRTRRSAYMHVDISNEEIMRHDEYLSQLREQLYEELITVLKKMDNDFEKKLKYDKAVWGRMSGTKDYTDFLYRHRYTIQDHIQRRVRRLQEMKRIKDSPRFDENFHYRLSHIQKYIDANMKTAISPDDIENAFAK